MLSGSTWLRSSAYRKRGSGNHCTGTTCIFPPLHPSCENSMETINKIHFCFYFIYKGLKNKHFYDKKYVEAEDRKTLLRKDRKKMFYEGIYIQVHN